MDIEESEKNKTNSQSDMHSWHEPHAGKLVVATELDDSKLSLPPHLSKKIQQASNGVRFGVVLLVIISLVTGFLGGLLGVAVHDQTSSTVSPTTSKQSVVSDQANIVHQIAQNVGQSVVSIVATGPSVTPNPNSIFGGTVNGGTEQDAGTGIIISSDGLIITNRHVIPAGATVSVTLSDGSQYNNVEIVGRTSTNDSLDVAFLKIQNLNGKKLVPATIGDSSEVKVGDQVVAIGNALGQFQNTVTSGIISGYGRSVQASDSTGTAAENLDDLFQTDTAINSGNSGGPLVNLSGQVIGINTAIASGAQNIGFAIPINDVTGLMKTVEQTGKLEQPYLGVFYIPLTNDVAQQYNLSVNSGAWVPPSTVIGQDPIIAGGPADKAGIRAGDIITQVNSTAINKSNSLTSVLDQLSVGSNVRLTVNRNGKTITLNATLGDAPTG